MCVVCVEAAGWGWGLKQQRVGLHNGLLTLPLKSGKYLDAGEVSGARRHVQSKLQVELGAKNPAYSPRTCRSVAYCSCIVCWVWCMQQQSRQSPMKHRRPCTSRRGVNTMRPDTQDNWVWSGLAFSLKVVD